MYVTRRLKCFPIGDGRHLAANAVTGALTVVDDAVLAALDLLRAGAECPPALADELRGRGLLWDEADGEDRAFEAACRRSFDAFRARSPRHYTFVVNAHCNFACRYCFEHAYDLPKATLSREQVDAAFAVVDRLAAHDTTPAPPDIEVFGGEPLLPGSRDIVGTLLRRVGERGGKASIQTNGYHLRECLPLLRAHAAQVAQVQVTLDGPRPVHDRRRTLRGGGPSFERIVAAIDALAAEPLPVRITVRTNVDADNAAWLPELAGFYASRGWTANGRFSFVAAPVDDRSGTLRGRLPLLSWPQMLDRVLPLSREGGGGPFELSVFKVLDHFRHCFTVALAADGAAPGFVPKAVYCEAAALKLLAFHPDGRLYPCPEAVGQAELAIGDYAPRLRLDRRAARMWRGQTILKRPACRECAVSTFCGGGCVLAALRQHRTMAEPVCDGAEQQLERFVARLTPA